MVAVNIGLNVEIELWIDDVPRDRWPSDWGHEKWYQARDASSFLGHDQMTLQHDIEVHAEIEIERADKKVLGVNIDFVELTRQRPEQLLASWRSTRAKALRGPPRS